MDIKKLSLGVVGTIWLAVGIGLSIAGVNWLIKLPLGPKLIILILISIAIGLLKGKFVMQKVAVKYHKKSSLIEFKKNDILTGWVKIMGIRGFVLIGIMMAIGIFLRLSSIPRPILGILYLAVGIALVYASKIFFESSNTKLKQPL